MAHPNYVAEVFQIGNLMDYGFFARGGAVLGTDYAHGRLIHPEAFNYIHHPYLGHVWIFSIFYALGGAWGVLACTTAAALFNTLFSYHVFRRWFDVFPSVIATVLYTLAPCFLIYATETHNLNLGSLAWPVGTFLFMSGPDGRPPRWKALWIFAFALLATQLSWFTITLFPTFFLMSAIHRTNWKETLSANVRNRVWWAIFIGGTVGVLLFLLQIVIYSPSVAEPFLYAKSLSHPGSGGEIGFAPTWFKMMKAFSIRGVVMGGPLLWVGVPLGLYLALKRKLGPPSTAPMFLYLAIWFGLVLKLPLKFLTDPWPYLFILFPLTFITAAVLQQVKSRALSLLFLALTIPCVIYAQVRASVPAASKTTVVLASYLSRSTQPGDLVLTNLTNRAYPFPSWEWGGCGSAGILADRLIFEAVESNDDILRNEQLFAGHVRRVLYLRLVARPLSPGLKSTLDSGARLIDTTTIKPVIEPKPLMVRLASFYWKLQSRTAESGADNDLKQDDVDAQLELYELPLLPGLAGDENKKTP